MKIKKYSIYHTSINNGLFKLPANWVIQRLKNFICTIQSGSRETGGGNQLDCGVFSIGGEHIGWDGKFILEPAKFISYAYYYSLKAGKILERDVLLVKDGATIGKCAYVNKKPFKEMALNEHVFLFRTKENSKFLYYFLISNIGQEQIKLEMRGSAQPGLSSQFIDKTFISSPPIDVQKEIADFLDQEIAIINQLIEKKEKLVKLLKSRISRIISEEYNASLAIGAKEHKLKYLLTETLRYGANETGSEEDNDSIRYIRITDLNDEDSLKDNTYKSLAIKEAEPYLLKDGDILLARSGSVGKSFIYKDTFGPCCYASYLIRVRLNKRKALPEYIKLFTECERYWEYIYLTNIQATIQNINAERYANIKIPLSDINQQKEFIHKISDLKNLHNVVIKKTYQSIALLALFKSSLITEAVTGQLNIQEWKKRGHTYCRFDDIGKDIGKSKRAHT